MFERLTFIAALVLPPRLAHAQGLPAYPFVHVSASVNGLRGPIRTLLPLLKRGLGIRKTTAGFEASGGGIRSRKPDRPSDASNPGQRGGGATLQHFHCQGNALAAANAERDHAARNPVTLH